MIVPTLAERLRDATRSLHQIAETSGLMKRLLQGRIEQGVYCRLLRNLHALYSTLEGALDLHARLPVVAAVRSKALFRHNSIADDLRNLHGADWPLLPLTRSMHSYTARIEYLAEKRPELLVAHAYVRYMGDLSGGQVVSAVVRRIFLLEGAAGTAFYAFGSREQVECLRRQFRESLNALVVDAQNETEIIAEAATAFRFHVELFNEIDYS